MTQIRLSKQDRGVSRHGRTPPAAIPGTWTEVCVSPDPSAHVQATGRDARGRKQYLYHPDWHTAQVEFKSERFLGFVRALPQLRERVETDLRRPGFPKIKVAAALVRLLEIALAGVGEEAGEGPRPPGSAPLLDRVGNDHIIDVQDRRRARVVKRWHDLPRQVSFHYQDDEDQRRSLVPADVEDYLRAEPGERFSAKELRAWVGFAFAARGKAEMAALVSTRALARAVLRAAEPVARRLGGVALRRGDAMVPVAVLEAHVHGSLARTRREEMGQEVAVEANVAVANAPRTAGRSTSMRLLGETRAPAPRVP